MRYQVKNYGLGTRFDLHHDTRQSVEEVFEVFVFIFIFVFVFVFNFIFVYTEVFVG